MRTPTNTRSALPSQDEARSTLERARQLRAETLGRMLRAAWTRLAGRPVGAMPHARA